MGEIETACLNNYASFKFSQTMMQKSIFSSASITSYQELEVDLQNNDVVEFISHHTGSQRRVWINIFNNGQSVTDPNLPHLEQVTGTVEFYIEVTSPGHYDIKLYNTVTGVTSRYTYIDNTPSYWISGSDGSTELYYTIPIATFRTDTTIEQRGVKQGNSIVYYPTTAFYLGGIGANQQYVGISASQDSARRYHITTHWAGSSVT